MLNDDDWIIDDEKLSGTNALGNRYFDLSAASPSIQLQQKTKLKCEIIERMAISVKGISNVYVH